MNNENLVTQMESLLAENAMLKEENIKLRENLKIQKSWTSIRESYLIPILRERYGEGRCIQTGLITQIGNIVKEYLGVSRLTEITAVNYDYAKEIALAVVNTLIKFEWIHLNKMQEFWENKNMNAK
ncbi:hypothetical protein [Clostridium tertium]|uniref:hypothetical protein n=1 Tax=Clostridium tertium TaxID=1559 RepID=UPI003DA685DC